MIGYDKRNHFIADSDPLLFCTRFLKFGFWTWFLSLIFYCLCSLQKSSADQQGERIILSKNPCSHGKIWCRFPLVQILVLSYYIFVFEVWLSINTRRRWKGMTKFSIALDESKAPESNSPCLLLSAYAYILSYYSLLKPSEKKRSMLVDSILGKLTVVFSIMP